MFLQRFCIFIILFLFVNITNAQQTGYNNFGDAHNGWDYNWGLGWSIAGDNVTSQFGIEQAMGFEPTEGGFVTNIWIAISYVPMSSSADTVIIRLTDNPNGLPPEESNILEEWMLTDFDNWSQWNTPIHLEASNTTMIETGHDYWLWAIAKETTWTMWCMNEDAAFTCPHTIRREGEDWLPIGDETASAFRVDVSMGVGISPITEALDSNSLSQNYPNPFSSSTKISYSIAKLADVSLKVYDMYGREIQTLVNEVQSKGNYTIDFNATNIPGGFYIYKLMVGDQLVDVRKMSRQ